VDAVRSQLAPIRSLSALADSFAREGLHITHDATVGPSIITQVRRRRFGESPLEVAYVARWIELDAGTALRAWRSLVDESGTPP
jgi:hypothetical protein